MTPQKFIQCWSLPYGWNQSTQFQEAINISCMNFNATKTLSRQFNCKGGVLSNSEKQDCSEFDDSTTRQIWGIWKLRPAYSPETPNSGQKRWCFVPCDLEIWWMTLENNRAPLLCCFKLCATFHNHQWIQTGVAVQKRPISVKFDDF